MPRQENFVYEPLLNEIRGRISDGTAQPGTLVGTELQFGQSAHISRNSVRTAIDRLVAEGLVERRPGKGVFVRSKTATRTVEVVMPGLAGFWAAAARGAQAFARDRGVRMRIFSADGDVETDLQEIGQLPDRPVDGALIGWWYHTEQARVFCGLARREFPFVVIGQRVEGLDASSVEHDRYALGYLAGQQLTRRSHRRIGFIGYLGTPALHRRLDGLRDAVNDAGIVFDRTLAQALPMENLIRFGEVAVVNTAIRQLLERPDRPTAIVFHLDEHAALAYPIARALGLRIPNDVSLVGSGNHDEWTHLDPQLTTIDLQSVETGRVAMELLLKLLQNHRSVEHRVIEGHWVERGSVATRSQ